MKRGHLLAAFGLGLALLLALPLDLLLRPLLFGAVVGAGVAVLVGAREVAGKLAGAAVVLFLGATLWGGLSEATRALFAATAARSHLGDAVPFGAVALGVLLVLAVCLLLGAKLRLLLPPPAAPTRPLARSRALVVEPQRALMGVDRRDEATDDAGDDDLGLLERRVR